MHLSRIRNLLVLVFCYLAVPESNYAQIHFADKLKSIRDKYSASAKDSTLFYAALENIKKEYKDSIPNCPHNYLINKTLGAYYFSVLQDDNLAMAAQKEVLKDQLQCLEPSNPEIAITYFNIAQSLDFLGKIKEAEDYYFKVIDIENSLSKPHISTSNHFTEIGNFYGFQGDNKKAIFYFEKAEASHIGPKDKYYRNLLRAKSMALEKEGQYENAIRILKEALLITHKQKNDAPIKEARILDDISKQYRFLNDFDNAEKYIQQAIKVASNIPDIRPQDYNNLLNHYSHIRKEQGNYDQAIQLLQEVRKSYLNNISSTKLSRISGNYENMGDVYFLQKDYQKALENYQEGMRFLANDLSNDYLQHPKIKDEQYIGESYLLRQLGLKAKALYALAEEKNDTALFLSTLDAIEKYDTLNRRLFKENWDEKSYLPLLKSSRPYYQLGINSAFKLHTFNKEDKYLERAYAIIAKLKSQLLDRSISIEELKKQKFSADILEKEKSLKDSIAISSKVYQQTSLDEDGIRKKAFDKFAKHKIELALYQQNVGIDKIVTQNENITVPSIATIQSQLGNDEALLEFHISKDRLFYFLISNTQVIANSETFEKSKIISGYDRLTQGENAHNFLPQNLMDALNALEKSKLIIIPDQNLLQFPFEALALDDTRILLNKFEISYEYGSGFLFDKKKTTNNSNIAAFASDYSKKRILTPEDSNNSYSELNHTVLEARSAQEIFDGALFTNQKASKSNLVSNLKNYGIFHFALHGTLDEQNPDNSALIFENMQGLEELTASEIYNLELPANLIVLSACNSGVGPVEIGDGVRSLTRSFIHAGSAGVITSLWASSDASTRSILDKFYQLLQSGKSKREALRLAKLQYIEKASPTFRQPKYWAHLILVGDHSPLTKSSSNKFILLLGGIVLLLLFLLTKKRTR